MSGEQNETSRFNDGMNQVNRLHFAWIEAERYASDGNLEDYKWKLVSIWNELYSDDKEYKLEFKDKIEALDKLISRFWNNKKMAFKLLTKKNQLLRELQNKAGKGTSRMMVSEEEF